MRIYYLLIALLLLTAILMRGNQPKNLKYVIVSCLLIFAVYGLRNTYWIGVDSRYSYRKAFESISQMSWTQLQSAGQQYNNAYYYLNWIVARLGGDYQLFVSLEALFVTVCFGRMLYRYSPSPIQSICYHFGLLFFVFHFSALKQSYAMAFLMLAFDQIVHRKPVRFILLVLIASQFHYPSLVFLPAYWITMVRPGKSFLILLAIALLLTFIFRNRLLNLMLSAYKGTDEEATMEGVTFLRTKSIIMIVIVVAAVVFRRPTADDPIYGYLMEFMGIAIVFQTFCGYSNIFERLADYYFQFSVIFIPMVFDRQQKQRALLSWRLMDVIYSVAPFVFCGYGIYRYLITFSGDYHFVPFKFFFEG
jgi:hypothetical protein